MERGLALMRASLLATLALLVLSVPVGARADHSMVLVTSRNSSFSSLSSLEIRKAYLGFDVVKNGKPVFAVSNRSNERAGSIFLQNVIGMSERSYDRRLLTLTLQSGRSRPVEFDDLDTLLDYVESHPNFITFVWEEDLEGRENLQLIRVLWHR
jgi:hypothetical protein